jgi:selenide,water dikinase
LLGLPKLVDENVLVDVDTCDDAGVYRIDDDRAVVFSADFFPPVVNDPFTYGEIAVANSISDIYAMGSRPFVAINLLAFPQAVVPPEIIGEILRGAGNKMKEAGIALIGGHTMDDERINYGQAVLGWIDPKRIITNFGTMPGDALVLTKPLGSGIITTAMRSPDLVSDKIVGKISKVMGTLNKTASERMLEYDVRACTDVTGYGFLGHLSEMLEASNVTAILKLSDINYFPEAEEFCRMGILPGGSIKNRQFIQDSVEIHPSIEDPVADVLFDAQTSGGLIVAIPEKQAEKYLKDIKSRGIEDASIVGRIVEPGDKRIILEP